MNIIDKIDMLLIGEDWEMKGDTYKGWKMDFEDNLTIWRVNKPKPVKKKKTRKSFDQVAMLKMNLGNNTIQK